jgi:hypothetical protein
LNIPVSKEIFIMKKQNSNNKLAFNKANVTELSGKSLSKIVGGYYDRGKEYCDPLSITDLNSYR